MSDGCIYALVVSVLICSCLSPCSTQISPTNCGTNTTICGQNSNCSTSEVCQCNGGFSSPSGSNTDCINSSVPNPNCNIQNCNYCPVSQCIRCITGLALLTNGNVQSCVRACPSGYSIEITRVNGTGISVTACTRQGSEDSSSGIPGLYIGIIIGISAIVTLIVITMIIYCFWALKRRKLQQTFEVQDENSSNDVSAHQNEAFLDNEADGQLSDDENEDYTELAGGDEEKAKFLQKLARLRKQSSVFLRMLNDMRRRLKELPQDAPAAKSYKNVMQDVTRLLYLLNKKPQNVEMPPDGMQLLNWSEEILKRYLQSQQQRTNYNRISTYGQQAETHF